MVDLENKEMYFGNSVRVQSASSTNEKFWCNGQNYLPTLFEPDGTMSATVNPEAMDIGEGVMLNGNTAGNAFKAFTFGGVQYGVATRYNIVTSVTMVLLIKVVVSICLMLRKAGQKLLNWANILQPDLAPIIATRTVHRAWQ